MKIGSSLALICIGAILAFAVTTNTSVFNLHTAGWVVMLIGVINNGLSIMGVPTYWQYIVQGVLLIIALFSAGLLTMRRR